MSQWIHWRHPFENVDLKYNKFTNAYLPIQWNKTPYLRYFGSSALSWWVQGELIQLYIVHKSVCKNACHQRLPDSHKFFKTYDIKQTVEINWFRAEFIQ